MDVSVAVMSVNKKSKRIDLDAGDNLYHLMVIFRAAHCYMNSEEKPSL